MPKKAAVPLDYIESSSKLDIKKFFNGDIEAFSIKQDENEKIIGTAIIKISGKWDENKGTIQQNFVYNDGTKDSRTWLITLNSDGTFDAIGHDVSSPAQGKQIGNAALSNYTLAFGSKAAKEEVSFDDRMYMVDEKSMIMISSFKKLGSKSVGKNLSGKSIISLKKIDSNKKSDN